MQVILNQDIKELGKKGELVNVSDGYAKNYLIPRKFAVAADASALNELKNRESSKGASQIFYGVFTRIRFF